MPSLSIDALGVALLAGVLWTLIRRSRKAVLDNIPGPPSESWLNGSLNQLMNRKAWDFNRHIAETYGGVSRIKGIFGSNALFVYDPKALHHILIKVKSPSTLLGYYSLNDPRFMQDQYTYEEPDSVIESNKILFGEGLFTSLGERHRHHRKMLNPVFSINHMREMGERSISTCGSFITHSPSRPKVPIFYDVSHKLENTLVKMTERGPKEVDILGWNTRLAMELIGQSGLGYTFDTLQEGAIPHPFANASKQLIPMSGDSPAIMAVWVVPTMTRIGSPRFRRFLVNCMPFKIVRTLRDILDTIHSTAFEILESKKKALREGDEALAEHIGHGKDIISILMKANMEASGDERLTDAELLGQITSLTFAATDTTSGALSRILHLLSTHKDYQSKVREEIRNAKKENGGEDIEYDTLVSLPLLDAICRETLRLYPPVSNLFRTAVSDIVLPLSEPIKGLNGDEIHEVAIPKDTQICVSILASNRNPKLWGSDSYEWKPERWLNPLPQPLVDAHIPGVYSHFGFKFSQLEMKVALALLLDKLEFSPSDKNVVWHMTGIVTPHESFESKYPSLPIVISRAD
ncbi:hypothetical protein NLJ89_g1511 [Agrocybe chaxingu]|uniref:Cytochrome P450 n=1 Tax=Agrocybe chaxingu TaxID=84603 RepID=A0A9W8MZV7_9AGAR|nr:hypothetical protein NLJ89_g1511 [Agrocybe chaxingu]